jgi:transcriptional regulator with XRE-family HTH domain
VAYRFRRKYVKLERPGRKTLDEIRAELKNRRISIRAVERRLGKSQNWLSNRLTHQVKMDVGGLYEVLEELNVQPIEFFERVLPERTVERIDSATKKAGERLLKRRK